MDPHGVHLCFQHLRPAQYSDVALCPFYVASRCLAVAEGVLQVGEHAANGEVSIVTVGSIGLSTHAAGCITGAYLNNSNNCSSIHY